ncbi:hypothetical protein EDD99_5441 [Streptomyces sp. 846.5]|nr:hypothetical protein [Streptomyces sp. 846.5]TDT97320.1 hypothetical protein EDD99_5441 [Streptomyces sp. 846.5]
MTPSPPGCPEPTGEATPTAYVHCPGGTRHPFLITWPIDLGLARTAVAGCTLDHDAPEVLDPTELADETFPYVDRESIPPDYADPAVSWAAGKRSRLALSDQRHLHKGGPRSAGTSEGTKRLNR